MRAFSHVQTKRTLRACTAKRSLFYHMKNSSEWWSKFSVALKTKRARFSMNLYLWQVWTVARHEIWSMRYKIWRLGIVGDPVDVVGHLRVDSGISSVGAADSPRDDAALHVAVLKHKFGKTCSVEICSQLAIKCAKRQTETFIIANLMFSMRKNIYRNEENLMWNCITSYLADEWSAGVALARVLALLAGAQHLLAVESVRAVGVLAGGIGHKGNLKVNYLYL